MSNLTLYGIPPSPPYRAALMVASALGVVLNLKQVNLMEGEHLKEDFLKVNISIRLEISIHPFILQQFYKI